MRKNFAFLSLVAVLFSMPFISSAQNTSNARMQTAYQPCNAIAHPLFEPKPEGKTPVTLNRLGTSPQFGEIKSHTAAAAYSHLKRVYARNSARNKREIDNLLQAMGYTGLNDPNFTTSSIVAETLPAGTTGWMGAYSRGHKYAWSVMGKPFQAFRINSTKGDCYVYIMRKCGNAFYSPMETPINITPEVECVTQTLSISGQSKIEKTNLLKTTATVQLVATNGTNPNLCVGSTEVPVAATYSVFADGSINYSKVFDVCATAGSTPAAINMASPIQLSVDVSDARLTLGNNGAMMMPVSDNQYKQLKRIYSECPTDMAMAEAFPTYTRDETGSSAMQESRMATSNAGTDGQKCKTQTMSFMGESAIADGVVKSASKQVTVIARWVKTGSLTKGETADKYLCLGTYPMNAAWAAAVDVKGSSKVMKTLEVCDKGDTPSTMDYNVPIKLNFGVSSPDMTMGDSDRIYVDVDASQYKTLSKRFSRCCGIEGNDKCI